MKTYHAMLVRFGEIGQSSIGASIVKPGSLELRSNEPEDTKILLEHDPNRPVGHLVSVTQSLTGYEADMVITDDDICAKIDDGTRGNVSLGLYGYDTPISEDGSSVEIRCAAITEISLVSVPAFPSSKITK